MEEGDGERMGCEKGTFLRGGGCRGGDIVCYSIYGFHQGGMEKMGVKGWGRAKGMDVRKDIMHCTAFRF